MIFETDQGVDAPSAEERHAGALHKLDQFLADRKYKNEPGAAWKKRRQSDIERYGNQSISSMLPEQIDGPTVVLTRTIGALSRMDLHTKNDLINAGTESLFQSDKIGGKYTTLAILLRNVAMIESNKASEDPQGKAHAQLEDFVCSLSYKQERGMTWTLRRQADIEKYANESILGILPEHIDGPINLLVNISNALGSADIHTKKDLLTLDIDQLRKSDNRVGKKAVVLIKILQDIVSSEQELSPSQ